jgi:hypothetical protein
MSDRIDEQMSKYGDFPADEVWELFKAGFLTKSPEARIADLKTMDFHLEAQTGLTREHASMVQKRREIVAIHQKLRELNR